MAWSYARVAEPKSRPSPNSLSCEEEKHGFIETGLLKISIKLVIFKIYDKSVLSSCYEVEVLNTTVVKLQVYQLHLQRAPSLIAKVIFKTTKNEEDLFMKIKHLKLLNVSLGPE